MCGIAGIIHNKDSETGKADVLSMLKTIEHRGPDSFGAFSTDGFAFGMRRLSIIDLKDGDQPIWSDDGIGIVFNGEIYNFKALRNELEKQGIHFKTHSDTEVILQLYRKKGIGAIQELEGMFGICIYDPTQNKVFLIRDRLGIKPLYYYYNKEENLFVFGSEIKAILECLPEKPNINSQAIWDYLTLRYVPGSGCIWDNIQKTPPAHYITFDLELFDLKIQKYWDLQFHSQKSKKKTYDKEFENLFLEAVDKRLLASDVPVGILLSGGLDSSALAAAAVELGHRNFHTFSIGFEDGGEYSELNYARQMAEHIGSKHHEITIGQKEFLDFLPNLTHFSDEPLADLASVPLYYVSKLARQHVKVVLSGEGSDEILAGYNLEVMAQHLAKLKRFSHLPDFILKRAPFQSLQTLSQVSYKDFLKSHGTHITNNFTESEKNVLCKFVTQNSTVDQIKQWYDLSSSPEPLDQLQQAYCHSWLVEDLLMKADKMSMATSLEVRVPFLDHKLVEWASKLPHEWKVGNGKVGYSSKRILRRFAAKRLPQEIIDRPKKGFPVPAYLWLQNNLQEWASEKLNSPALEQYFHKSAMEKVLQESHKGSLQATHKVWNLIIFNEWLDQWQN